MTLLMDHGDIKKARNTDEGFRIYQNSRKLGEYFF